MGAGHHRGSSVGTPTSKAVGMCVGRILCFFFVFWRIAFHERRLMHRRSNCLSFHRGAARRTVPSMFFDEGVEREDGRKYNPKVMNFIRDDWILRRMELR